MKKTKSGNAELQSAKKELTGRINLYEIFAGKIAALTLSKGITILSATELRNITGGGIMQPLFSTNADIIPAGTVFYTLDKQVIPAGTRF